MRTGYEALAEHVYRDADTDAAIQHAEWDFRQSVATLDVCVHHPAFVAAAAGAMDEIVEHIAGAQRLDHRCPAWIHMMASAVPTSLPAHALQRLGDFPELPHMSDSTQLDEYVQRSNQRCVDFVLSAIRT